MSNHLKTAIAGSALLIFGSAFAQSPGQSQSQEKQRQSQQATKDSKDTQSQADKSAPTRQARADVTPPVKMMMMLIPVSMECKRPSVTIWR